MAATIYGVRVEFREILRKRRMHRAFLPDPLPADQIERIAGVIKRAPSGGFSQGGSIVVVTDDEKRAAIARAFGDEHYSSGGRNFIADAPVHMVISANEALYHARYNEADKLAAIFEKFTRGERESATPGVGLGLAICRAIIEAHGGTIRAGDSPEGGAAIVFTLPLGIPPSMPDLDAGETGVVTQPA